MIKWQLLPLLLTALTVVNAQTLECQGQLSLVHARTIQAPHDSPTTLRYIPQLRTDYQLNTNQRLGLDVAVDLYTYYLDVDLADHDLKFYRMTFRYDTPAIQARLGLQKINFGPARMLRVLQWFDQLDPRDPLALSPGVWAALGRYYFQDGANLRLWTLIDAPDRYRDLFHSNADRPVDAGGRFEYPLSAGTLGLTLHKMDITSVSGITESRGALDIRLDAIVGLWSEIMLSRTELPFTQLDNLMAMAGMDYTFSIGNGLYLALELLTSHSGTLSENMPWQLHSLALTGNYALGLADSITGYLYAVQAPQQDSQYIPMLGWQHTQGNWLFYSALYHRPTTSMAGTLALPSGTGLQFNIAFNY